MRSVHYSILALCAAVLLSRLAVGQETKPIGQSVEINGMQMYFEVHGEGEPLLLLHWYGANGQRTWGQFIPELKSKYKLIVPDLRGHGRSTNPLDTFTHRQSALDVYALLDRLGIRQFRAMGVSTGGMTLLHMATQQRNRVQAMVLVGATHYFPEQAREIMKKATLESKADDEEWWAEKRQMHHHGDERRFQ